MIGLLHVAYCISKMYRRINEYIVSECVNLMARQKNMGKKEENPPRTTCNTSTPHFE